MNNKQKREYLDIFRFIFIVYMFFYAGLCILTFHTYLYFISAIHFLFGFAITIILEVDRDNLK